MSRSEHLLLPRQIHTAMLQHAQVELPNECCGILAGSRAQEGWRVERSYPLVNEAASTIEYRSEPRSMFQAIKEIRQQNHEILAIYHSHPTTDPIPSGTDLARNYSTDVVNFIIGMRGPTPLLRGWWLSETAFTEAAWEIVEVP